MRCNCFQKGYSTCRCVSGQGYIIPPAPKDVFGKVRTENYKPKPASELSDFAKAYIKQYEEEKALTQGPQNKEIGSGDAELLKMQKQMSQCNSESETMVSQSNKETAIRKMHAEAWGREAVYDYAYGLGLQDGHIAEATAIRVGQSPTQNASELTQKQESMYYYLHPKSLKVCTIHNGRSIWEDHVNKEEFVLVKVVGSAMAVDIPKQDEPIFKPQNRTTMLEGLVDELQEKLRQAEEMALGREQYVKWADHRIYELEREVERKQETIDQLLKIDFKEERDRFKTALENVANSCETYHEYIKDIAREALKDQGEG